MDVYISKYVVNCVFVWVGVVVILIREIIAETLPFPPDKKIHNIIRGVSFVQTIGQREFG